MLQKLAEKENSVPDTNIMPNMAGVKTDRAPGDSTTPERDFRPYNAASRLELQDDVLVGGRTFPQ